MADKIDILNRQEFVNKGIVSDSFWERHSSYLDCFGEIEDAEKQSLSHLSSQLFSGIDIRTQEKIIGRINVLHRLAFGNLTDLSVLYYELLHQIVQYKFSKEHISDWLPEIDHASKQVWIDALGNDLYKYIKELEGKSYQNNVIFSGDIQGTYHEILHCSFALAFWYISALKHPIKNDTCCRYFLRDSHKYDKIVVAAKKFDELATMIR